MMINFFLWVKVYIYTLLSVGAICEVLKVLMGI